MARGQRAQKVDTAKDCQLDGVLWYWIKHPDLSFKLSYFFNADGIHFSDWEQEICLWDVSVVLPDCSALEGAELCPDLVVVCVWVV